MACGVCGSAEGFRDGRCARCGSAEPPSPQASPPRLCRKCKTPAEPAEKFCSKCGEELRWSPQKYRAAYEKQENLQKINKGRGWLLAVAILTFLGGALFYFKGKSEVEKQIGQAEAAMRSYTPQERDAHFKKTVGMTWQEAIDSDRGRVSLLFAINMALGVIYLGLWWWARTNAFAAALVALLIYITVIGVSALIEPASLLQGIIIKPFVIIALLSAISAAYKQRKLYGVRT